MSDPSSGPNAESRQDADRDADQVAALEAGHKLFTRPIEFVLGAARLEQLPPGDRLEICFAGRSNVGKSSLVNALTNRKALARTSNTPGRTQQLNYFDLDGQLYLVDVPGYGFAQAPKNVVAAWQKVLRAYLQGRANLRRVFLLIDGRHGPKKADLEAMDLLDGAAVSYQVVLTKADKPKPAAFAEAKAATETAIAKRAAAHPEILVTSSETGVGVPELRAAIAALL